MEEFKVYLDSKIKLGGESDLGYTSFLALG